MVGCRHLPFKQGLPLSRTGAAKKSNKRNPQVKDLHRSSRLPNEKAAQTSVAALPPLTPRHPPPPVLQNKQNGSDFGGHCSPPSPRQTFQTPNPRPEFLASMSLPWVSAMMRGKLLMPISSARTPLKSGPVGRFPDSRTPLASQGP